VTIIIITTIIEIAVMRDKRLLQRTCADPEVALPSPRIDFRGTLLESAQNIAQLKLTLLAF
jgi:hypothetical protein